MGYKNIGDYEQALNKLSEAVSNMGNELNEWKLSLNAHDKGSAVKESEETILAKSLRATGDCRELSAKMDCILSVVENIMNYITNSEDLPEEVADAAKEYCYDVVERSMVVHEQIYTTLNKQADMVNQIL